MMLLNILYYTIKMEIDTIQNTMLNIGAGSQTA